MPRGSKPGERRGGRKKGTPNKVTKALKDMVLGALDQAGGEEYLLSQAKDNPSAFLTLIGKILPSEIKTEVTGKDGGPIQFSDTERAARLAALLNSARKRAEEE